MDRTGTREKYGRSMAVAVGWYATAIAAVVVGTASVPSAPEVDCSAMFSCLSPLESLVLAGVFWGGPVLVALLVITAVVDALVVRRVSSVVLAGTLSVAVSFAVCAVVAAAYLGGRS
ncbi:hypothetical protein DKT68_17505 [Micromonospora acroterricola]|uniref:Uncharacterized protein n=1 Tax=Micromonospora acroterricola TaxID=2202421 RepID=A0A317CZN2_9ACTN|nr:hypothetical protein [Micromonospora acroterricola]PWR07909.1 hypothetical protein DKT68_17505 [Micromonospora acroterricola]